MSLEHVDDGAFAKIYRREHTLVRELDDEWEAVLSFVKPIHKLVCVFCLWVVGIRAVDFDGMAEEQSGR